MTRLRRSCSVTANAARDTPPLPAAKAEQVPEPYVFVSYARDDTSSVMRMVDIMNEQGISAWVDEEALMPGDEFDAEIVAAIRGCAVLAVFCTNSSMRSRHVKQEIQLAWMHERPIVPVLLAPVSYPDQLAYWLSGRVILDATVAGDRSWCGSLQRALAASCHPSDRIPTSATETRTLEGLRRVASYTDRIWPIPGTRKSAPIHRGLGAAPTTALKSQALGSLVSLAIDADRDSHLILIDEGPEGIKYCLAPSWFAPSGRLNRGINYIPSDGSPFEGLLVTGRPGRENLLAILLEDPPPFDWMTSSPSTPARILDRQDVRDLLEHLRNLRAGSWSALATYFDISG